MPVTFETDNDIILYALEYVISYARRTQQIFVAQCVWWLASVLGLEKELVFHIDKLQGPKDTTLQERLHQEVSATPRDLANDQRIDQVLDYTEKCLRESKRLRGIAALKVSGKTITGRINPSKISKKDLRKSERKSKITTVKLQRDFSKTEGTDASELSRRKAANECLRCAWPSDRKDNHRVKDCRRQIKLTPGTVGFPKTHRKLTTHLGSSSSEESFESSDNIE